MQACIQFLFHFGTAGESAGFPLRFLKAPGATRNDWCRKNPGRCVCCATRWRRCRKFYTSFPNHVRWGRRSQRSSSRTSVGSPGEVGPGICNMVVNLDHAGRGFIRKGEVIRLTVWMPITPPSFAPRSVTVSLHWVHPSGPIRSSSCRVSRRRSSWRELGTNRRRDISKRLRRGGQLRKPLPRRAEDGLLFQNVR